jgi:hypothetical protein
MPKKDIIKFKYELDSIFRINNKIIIEIRIANIFIETINNDFE